MGETYPITALQRDRWILQQRGQKNPLEPSRPYAFLWEEECGANRELISTATIFLTNRECPFRCLMCDLWQNTLNEAVPAGAIAGQIRYALAQLRPARQIKLYNAGSFFDPQAIPPDDDPEIAHTLADFERVIVECHPAFLRGKYAERVLRFRDLMSGRLEVAIGLETVHEPTLQKLNKRMTLDDFQRAADFLKSNDMDLRVFLLLRPPFLTEAEGVEWACRSLDFAADCQADVCTVIPTRGGNGAMEALGEQYQPPQLSSLETVVEYGIGLHAFRVCADLWDVEKFYTCECSSQRAKRLAEINRTQQIPPAIVCRACNV